MEYSTIRFSSTEWVSLTNIVYAFSEIEILRKSNEMK